MNQNTKILLIIAAIIVGVGAFTYGALTAPQAAQQPPSPSSTPTQKKVDLGEQLKKEQKTILGVLTAKYPKIKTEYVINQGKLYDQGQWYGTTLTYRGKDTMNRDTLRVLMQKKDGIWVVRTTPPAPLLSTIEYPDVPKSVLHAINEPISLPGSDAKQTD